MIAALPMYDLPAVKEQTDQLWYHLRDSLRDHGLKAPDELTRGLDVWRGWQHPDLVLGQTCALPFRQVLHARVTLVGTIDYGLSDVPAGHYNSKIIVQANDQRREASEFQGAKLAYNNEDSHSGWQAARLWAEAKGILLSPKMATGSHANSVQAVAEGRAEIAAIDSVTWRILEQHEPNVRQLRVLDHSDYCPGLPYITAQKNPCGPYFNAVSQAINGLSSGVKSALGIKGFVRIPVQNYLERHVLISG